MAVNLATKYASKIDQAFSVASYTDKWVNKKYDFDGVKTVNVYTLTSQAPTDYDRTATGDRYGGNNELQDTVAAYTLANDKAFKVAIDKGNNNQQKMVKNAGEVLKLQIREQITPLVDKNVFAKVAAGATSKSQKVVYAAAKAYENSLEANTYLDEAKAPIDGRVLFVTPEYYNAIKTEIVKDTAAVSKASGYVGKGVVGELDGIPVVKVPTSYFPTNTLGLLWHRDAILGAKQITETRIITDSELVSGALVLGRFIYDAFVLAGKADAVASIVKSTTSSGGSGGSGGSS